MKDFRFVTLIALSCALGIAAHANEHNAAQTIQHWSRSLRIKHKYQETRACSEQYYRSFLDLPNAVVSLEEMKKLVADTLASLGLQPPFYSKQSFMYIPRPGSIEPEATQLLRKYTSGGYSDYNAFLRDPEQFEASLMAQLKTMTTYYGDQALPMLQDRPRIMRRETFQIQQMLLKLPVFAGSYVYRYAYTDETFLAQYQEGKVLHLHAFVSTSKRIEYPYGAVIDEERNSLMGVTPQQKILFVIHHKSARDVAYYSSKCYEEEALIPNDADFKVRKVLHLADRIHLVFVEEIYDPKPR